MKHNFTVRQGALDGVEAFISVAQHRSFRRAAAELGVTPSAISQAIRALEARIGAALFLRTTRSVGLTEVGERFLSRAKPAFEEQVAASRVARDLGQRPAGLLRLTAPRAVVPILLERLIASFCQAYPEIEVEIGASRDLVDIAAEGFDAGIRLGQFIEADMIAVRLTPSFPLAVVGSPEYLRGQKRPERIDDLREHAIGANGSRTCASLPAFTGPAAIGAGTCARPKPSTAPPSTVGKSWAISGPETIASIGLLPLTKDQGAIDPFERRMRRQARIWRGLDRYRHVLANFLAISGKHTMAGPPKMRRT